MPLSGGAAQSCSRYMIHTMNVWVSCNMRGSSCDAPPVRTHVVRGSLARDPTGVLTADRGLQRRLRESSSIYMIEAQFRRGLSQASTAAKSTTKRLLRSSTSRTLPSSRSVMSSNSSQSQHRRYVRAVGPLLEALSPATASLCALAEEAGRVEMRDLFWWAVLK